MTLDYFPFFLTTIKLFWFSENALKNGVFCGVITYEKKVSWGNYLWNTLWLWFWLHSDCWQLTADSLSCITPFWLLTEIGVLKLVRPRRPFKQRFKFGIKALCWTLQNGPEFCLKRCWKGRPSWNSNYILLVFLWKKNLKISTKRSDRVFLFAQKKIRQKKFSGNRKNNTIFLTYFVVSYFDLHIFFFLLENLFKFLSKVLHCSPPPPHLPTKKRTKK